MPAHAPTIDDLRRYAISRSLFTPATLPAAIRRLGFIQADPIRAPARAQDLTLRHRVAGYRAGDLEKRYPRLAVEEDFFVNYGFLSREVHALMHPRTARRPWPASTRKRAQSLLDFIRDKGVVHPREVDAHFAHGRVRNYWGGSSSATTHLLDDMHYRGMLRVVRRDSGIRLYSAHEHPPRAEDPALHREQLDALVDVIVGKYAPLPAASLSNLVVTRLRYGAPQWQDELRAAMDRAKARLGHARVDGVDWYWPAEERPQSARHAVREEVRLFTPFDPIVWDRRRFELFWGWAYRFEAYTPAAKRQLGYYALPMLWRDQVIGWANVEAEGASLSASFGHVSGRPPRDAAFRRELDAELQRMQEFLGLQS